MKRRRSHEVSRLTKAAKTRTLMPMTQNNRSVNTVVRKIRIGRVTEKLL